MPSSESAGAQEGSVPHRRVELHRQGLRQVAFARRPRALFDKVLRSQFGLA
jgi:hypothetical protein